MSKWAAYEGYPLVALRNLIGIERLTTHNPVLHQACIAWIPYLLAFHNVVRASLLDSRPASIIVRRRK
jgi:hypothetical protein